MPQLRERCAHRIHPRTARVTRLKRFESHRFIGDRRTMTYYDCDDPAQFATLSHMNDEDDLSGRNLLQAFGPDEPLEAENRSFSAAETPVADHSSPQIH